MRSSRCRRSTPSSPRPRLPTCVLLAGALASYAAPLHGDVIREESFALVRGWNHFQLTVEPEESSPEAALAAVAWESLWRFLPGTTEDEPGRWLSFHRDAPASLNSLKSFTGPGAYALFASAVGTLSVRGAFRAERRELRHGFQLFGPTISPETPPTLGAYFSRPGSDERIEGVFEHRDDAYRRVGDNEILRAGAAYLVVAAQDIPSPDPVRVGAGFGGLRFDSQTTFSELEFDVCAASAPRQLRLRATPSLVGPANTDWLEAQLADGSFLPLGAGAEAVVDVPPQTTRVRVALRASRQGVATASAALQSALIHVIAPEGAAAVEAELEAPTLQGMWVGEATVTEVERMSLYGGGFAPAPALPVSLIVEIPPTGRPRLLPCVQVESSRDGRAVTYRINAATFHESVILFGSIAASGASGALSGATGFAADHPLNPFRHRYHPEHRSGYDLERALTLSFEGGVPATELPSPFATVGVLRGTYEEEITGLSQEPIRIRGSFRLRRLARTNVTPCDTSGQ